MEGLFEYTSLGFQWSTVVYKTVNHRQNFANPVNGANTQMTERALRCARLKISKNTNNVHPTSFPGYSAELWWRSKHGTTPFNDSVAEVVRQYPMHWLTELIFDFTAVQFSRFTNVTFYLFVLWCARATLGDSDILDRCASDLYHYATKLLSHWSLRSSNLLTSATIHGGTSASPCRRLGCNGRDTVIVTCLVWCCTLYKQSRRPAALRRSWNTLARFANSQFAAAHLSRTCVTSLSCRREIIATRHAHETGGYRTAQSATEWLRPIYTGWSDVTESVVTIRSPFCGYNVA